MNNINSTSLSSAVKIATPLLAQMGKQKEINQIASVLETIDTTPACLLVCGEFKRGKSTFVNALIGRKICPTDTDICTSVVSIIKYGNKEKVTRYYGDLSNARSEVIQLDELERYTVGTAEEIDNTIYVEIELPLDTLASGIVVVDTPGVGGLDPRHATLTNFFLPKADITLFLTDVNEPMTTTELGFYKSKVLPYSKHTAIIVNKADLRDSGSVEDFRQDTITKIASVVQVSKSDITAIAVSSAAEAYPESDLGESNFAEVRNTITKLVSDYRREQKLAMKANLMELLELSIEPLKIQLAQIEQPDINQIDELDKRKKMIDKKLAELVDPGSAFRTAVAKEITVRREDIVNMLNEASVTLQSDTFNTLLKSPNARQSDGGKWVGRMLNDAIAEIGSSITLELNRVFSVIAAMPQFEGMLKFDFREYNQNIIIRDVQTSVPMNKRVTPMMSGIGIATISGSLFGPLGWLIGAGVGAFVAYRNQKDAGNMFTESNLRQVYQPQLSGAISSLNTYVNTRFQEFQQEWIGIITDRAKAYKNSLQESITNIQKVKQDISQAVTMRAQVQNRIKPLSAVKEMIVKSDV